VGDENKNFNKSMYDITWDEAIIKEGTKKGENYLLILKKETKNYDLIVYPVFEGKDYEVALKKYEDKFNNYSIALVKRRANEKRIEEEYQAKLIAYKKQQEELERKWKRDEENRFKATDTEGKVTRVFVINRFGTFNCDNPISYPKGVLCTLQLNNEKNNKIKCYNVYLVDKKQNGLFTYYKNPVLTFSFNPTSTNMLWTVENGVLYWLKPEQFKSINANRSEVMNVIMNKVTQEFTNPDEIKAYFNF